MIELGGLPVLGSESNEISTVDFRVIGDVSDGLKHHGIWHSIPMCRESCGW